MTRTAALLAVLLIAPLAACEPTCKQTCRKLVECDGVDSPRLPLEECTNSCLVQQQLYEDWDDTQLREDFGALKQCIRDEECAAIADGACYDEDLYVW